MPRKLYKQPFSLRQCINSQILSSLSLPVSVHFSLLRSTNEFHTIPCLDLVLRWVVLIEATSRVGISGRHEDKVRATQGLYNLVAGGSRNRLRNPKRGKVSATSEQAERGLETVRKVLESYFVDDMCHLFEEDSCGDLYGKAQHIDEDIAMGRELIESLVSVADRCVHTRHVGVVALLSLVFYLCEHLVASYGRQKNGLSTYGEVWNIEDIHAYTSKFCREVLTYCGRYDGYGCLPDYGKEETPLSTAAKMSKDDLSLCRISHGISVVCNVVSVICSSDAKKEGLESSMTVVEEICNRGDGGGMDMNSLKASVRGCIAAPSEKGLVGSAELSSLKLASTSLRHVVDRRLMPLFGIIGRSMFIRGKLREGDIEEYCGPSELLKDCYDSIKSDLGTLEDLPFGVSTPPGQANDGSPSDNDKNDSRVWFGGLGNLVFFLDNCVMLATTLAEECVDLLNGDEITCFDEYKKDTIRMIILGCIGTDLEGFMAAVYEEYALKEVVSGFEEGSGARGTRSCRTSGRRERSPKEMDGRTRKARLLKAENIGGPSAGRSADGE